VFGDSITTDHISPAGSIKDVAEGTPTMVFGGEEYGTARRATGPPMAPAAGREGYDRVFVRAYPPLQPGAAHRYPDRSRLYKHGGILPFVLCQLLAA
jgi:hypothetical protein